MAILGGQYEKALKQIDEDDKNLGKEAFHTWKGVCLKELGQYDKALNYLFIDPEERVMSSKVEISCCYILKGEIDKGIKLLDLIPELDKKFYMNIARALFDAGSYKKSEEFFDKFMTNVHFFSRVQPVHSEIDGFCKLSILKSEDIHTIISLGFLAGKPYDTKHGNIDIPSVIPDQLRFRWFMFSVCFLIQTNQVTEAFNKLKFMVACHKDNTQPQKILCFREVFFLASQWKARGCYYTALTQYRVIKMLRRQLNDVPELFLHDYNNVDLSKEMDECFEFEESEEESESEKSENEELEEE